MGADTAGRFLVVFGGRSAGWVDFDNDTHVMDLDNRRWLTLPYATRTSGPSDRFDAAEFSHGTRFYVFGGSVYYGSSPERQATYNEVWGFDFGTQLNVSQFAWVYVPTANTPPKRYGASMETIGDKAYLFGGRTDCLKNKEACPVSPWIDKDFWFDTWEFDVPSKTWTMLAPASNPGPRINCGTSTWNGKWYLMGGRHLGTNVTNMTFNDVWCFDPATKQWSAIEPAAGSPVPKPRYSPGSVSYNGHMYIFGGSYWKPLPNGTFYREWLNDTWQFTFETRTWRQLTPLYAPSPRETVSGVLDEGMWILFGGKIGWDPKLEVSYDNIYALDLKRVEADTASSHSQSGRAGKVELSLAHDLRENALYRAAGNETQAAVCHENALRLNPFLFCAADALSSMGRLSASALPAVSGAGDAAGVVPVTPQRPHSVHAPSAAATPEQTPSDPRRRRQASAGCAVSPPPSVRRAPQYPPARAPRSQAGAAKVPRMSDGWATPASAAPTPGGVGFAAPAPPMHFSRTPSALVGPPAAPARGKRVQTARTSIGVGVLQFDTPLSTYDVNGGRHSFTSVCSQCRYECKEAIAEFKKLPEKHYKTGWVLCQVGKALLETAQYNEAHEAFCDALEVDPHRTEGMEYYSTVLWHLRRDSELTRLAHSMMEFDRFSPQSWCALGNCYSLHQDHHFAEKAFTRATQLDARFAYAFSLCGHELIETQETDKATACFRNALAIDERQYNAWYGLGVVHQRSQKLKEARYFFERAIAINPLNSVLYTCLSRVLRQLKMYDQALAQANQALAVDPRNSVARINRAAVLVAMQRPKEALAEMQELLRVAPREALAHRLMYRVHAMLNNRVEAERHLQAAKMLGDTKTYARDILEGLGMDEDDPEVSMSS
eukprot:m51a1_g7334 putative cell division cycle protein 27 homolog (888) ;mRNA; f:186868-190739